ncbi:hypothetical protein ACIBG5_16855 [Kribbella sp. NPDC050241]|uniref:hypothetical protein n=1 Tax=Kribbella sp. NPDC050241 TaxID=3364115 RepID=UPI0037A8ACD2
MAIETDADAIMLRWTPEKEDLRELARRPAYRRQMVKPMAVATILLAVGLILKLTVLAVVGGVLLLLLGLLSGRARQLRWNNDPLVQDPVEYVADKRVCPAGSRTSSAGGDGPGSATSRRAAVHSSSGWG